MGAQRGDERALERQPEVRVVGRVLGLGVDADGAAARGSRGLGEVQDLLEGRDLELPVVLMVALGERLHGAQGLDLREREVGCEPALLVDAVHVLGRLAVGELVVRRDVRRAGDVRLMACDQVAVLRRHEVGLDVVRALRDGERVARERVVRPVAGRAAMADHERVDLVRRRSLLRLGERRERQ